MGGWTNTHPQSSWKMLVVDGHLLHVTLTLSPFLDTAVVSDVMSTS